MIAQAEGCRTERAMDGRFVIKPQIVVVRVWSMPRVSLSFAIKDWRIFMRILFTGGSGKAGRHAVAYLRDQGHSVVNFDQVPLGMEGVDDRIGDITDAGQVYDTMLNWANFAELEPGTRCAAFRCGGAFCGCTAHPGDVGQRMLSDQYHRHI